MEHLVPYIASNVLYVHLECGIGQISYLSIYLSNIDCMYSCIVTIYWYQCALTTGLQVGRTTNSSLRGCILVLRILVHLIKHQCEFIYIHLLEQHRYYSSSQWQKKIVRFSVSSNIIYNFISWFIQIQIKPHIFVSIDTNGILYFDKYK